jgi:hypothetical protein
MVLLAVSGVAFFFAGAEATPKFWAKMVIVLIACANGLAAHRLIFPWLRSAAATGNGRLWLTRRRARIAAASAAISSVSWSAALILGAWHGLTLAVTPILAVYTGGLCLAVSVSALLVAPHVFEFSDRASHNSLTGPRRQWPAVAEAAALAVTRGTLLLAGCLYRHGSIGRMVVRTATTRRDSAGS